MRFETTFLALILSRAALAAVPYGTIPLSFEANQGQAPSAVQYLARGQGYALLLRSTGADVRLQGGDELRINLRGARSDALLGGAGLLPGKSYYFTGSNPSGWRLGISNFTRVRARDIYPGIDVVYYGNERQLEYDFLVAPHADPRLICLEFDGAVPRVGTNGSVVLHMPRGDVQLIEPVAYQEIDGLRRKVRVRYVLQGSRAGFQLAAYDRSLPLVIDPVLLYSSYLGAGGLDGSSAVAVDSNGNAYVTGWTSSANLAVTAGAAQSNHGGMTDAFLVKVDPSGTVRLYTTYFGGSSNDYGKAVALDPAGNIYIAGSSNSSNFPLLNPIHTYAGGSDAFVAKFAPTGVLTYSTLIGGSGNDEAHAIAIDGTGAVYVAGSTDSLNFPTTAGAFRTSRAGFLDAFVVKLNAAGTAKTYSTYLGGSSTDEANGIAVNGTGEAWVSGTTWSPDFPLKNGLQTFGGSVEAFVAKLNFAGSDLLFSTFLGGTSIDEGRAITLDPAGNAYVTGSTSSTNFPATSGAYRTTPAGAFPDEDAFVTKYNATGTQVLYSTYLGGGGSESGFGIAADSQGNTIVTGQTASADFPVFSNVRDFSGAVEAFVAALNPAGNGLVFSSWLGGSGNEAGRSVAILPFGRMYIAGLTNSNDFPVRPATGALQPAPGGGIEDGFIAAMTYCDYTITPTASLYGWAADNGSLTMITNAPSCGWSISPGASWLTLTSPLSGAGSATITFSLTENTSAGSRTTSLLVAGQPISVTQNGHAPVLTIAKTHVGSFTQGQNGAAYTVTVSNEVSAAPTSGTVTVTEMLPSGLSLVSMSGTGWTCSGNACTRSDVLSGGSNYQPIVVTVNVAPNAPAQVTNVASVSGGGAATAAANDLTVVVAQVVVSGPLRYVPVTPCRVADTRKSNGPFGGPAVSGGASRDFTIPSSVCGVPSNAQGYSLNVTVVPSGPLGYLTLWPTGQTRPVASTLNSLDGRIKSNAAIVPAGTAGAVSVFASDTTNVVLDINGYFVPTTDPTALAFYPITPCRIADTRQSTGPLGGPSLSAGQSRTFPVLSSTCNLPSTARAYSLNFAAVPGGPLGYLTAWPTGQARPLVSSLNAPTSAITANAAIVPAGTNGSIDVFASDATNLVVDINGYFAPVAAGGLSLYTMTPCRVLDTRQPTGSQPITSLNVAVTSSACGVPVAAQAHVFSVTAVPPGGLGYLTLWPQSQTQPLASTLNALDGAITSNLAIVPTTNGSMSAFASNPTHLVLDISGYFAP